MSADPSDIQSQLDALARRRQLAEAMQQQYSQPQQQQVVNGRIMDQGAAPLIQGLASVVAGVRANKMGTEMQGLQKQQQDSARAALDEYRNATPEDKPAALQRLQSATSSPMTLAQQVIARATQPMKTTWGKPGEQGFDENTGKPIAGMVVPPAPKKPAKRTVEWKDVGDKLVPVYGDTGEDVPGIKPKAKSATPSQLINRFTPEDSDLLAAIAQRGVSLPQGLRSKEQMASTLRGLRERNAGLSSDDIAEKIASGQINFGAEKKETTTAAALAGKTSVGENELVDFIPKALAANASVPRGSFVPFNKLVQLGQANISDPKLKELFGRTQAILNAYDVVAARGGTDKEKRAHNREMLENADSPETYEVAAKVIADEANIAKKAARKSELPFSQRGDEGQTHPPAIQSLLDKYK